jgi:hypothetical protein
MQTLFNFISSFFSKKNWCMSWLCLLVLTFSLRINVDRSTLTCRHISASMGLNAAAHTHTQMKIARPTYKKGQQRLDEGLKDFFLVWGLLSICQLSVPYLSLSSIEIHPVSYNTCRPAVLLLLHVLYMLLALWCLYVQPLNIRRSRPYSFLSHFKTLEIPLARLEVSAGLH